MIYKTVKKTHEQSEYLFKDNYPKCGTLMSNNGYATYLNKMQEKNN